MAAARHESMRDCPDAQGEYVTHYAQRALRVRCPLTNADDWQRSVGIGDYPLRKRLSPEQLAGELSAMNVPNREAACIWRETIYKAIYALPAGGLRRS